MLRLPFLQHRIVHAGAFSTDCGGMAWMYDFIFLSTYRKSYSWTSVVYLFIWNKVLQWSLLKRLRFKASLSFVSIRGKWTKTTGYQGLIGYFTRAFSGANVWLRAWDILATSVHPPMNCSGIATLADTLQPRYSKYEAQMALYVVFFSYFSWGYIAVAL